MKRAKSDASKYVLCLKDSVARWPEARVDKIETTSDSVLIYFRDADGARRRAVFEVSQSDHPPLKSMKFECPACLGGGINDGLMCAMCDGGGWGAGVAT
jgi:hypothetical protein